MKLTKKIEEWEKELTNMRSLIRFQQSLLKRALDILESKGLLSEADYKDWCSKHE